MRFIHLIILIYLFIGLFSCTNPEINKNDIDKFISKYKNENFEHLRGISILQRSRDLNEIVYVVDGFEENKPPYFVEFNLSRQTININKAQLEKGGVSDYLTRTEITNAVNTIRKYDFFLLGVDSSNNVFINPFFANAPAYFLRLNTQTGDSTIKKGYVYELYKNNWYLNKSK